MPEYPACRGRDPGSGAGSSGDPVAADPRWLPGDQRVWTPPWTAPSLRSASHVPVGDQRRSRAPGSPQLPSSRWRPGLEVVKEEESRTLPAPAVALLISQLSWWAEASAEDLLPVSCVLLCRCWTFSVEGCCATGKSADEFCLSLSP